MSPRNPNSQHPAALIALAALAVAAAVIVGLSLTKNAPPTTGAPLAPITTTESSPVPVVRNTVKEGLADLASERPYTVAVLGDSTGASAGNWPQEIARWMGETYDRTVMFHSWREYSDEAIAEEGLRPGYVDTQVVHRGSGAPITFFNGSTPARNAEYSLEKIKQLIPVESPLDVDLVFVSHGHNEGPGAIVGNVGDLLYSQAPVYANATWVVILQNPERPNTPHADIQKLGTASLRYQMNAERFPTVDVEAAFEKIPEFWKLYEDALHLDPDQPKARETWVGAVLDVLEPAAPKPLSAG